MCSCAFEQFSLSLQIESSGESSRRGRFWHTMSPIPRTGDANPIVHHPQTHRATLEEPKHCYVWDVVEKLSSPFAMVPPLIPTCSKTSRSKPRSSYDWKHSSRTHRGPKSLFGSLMKSLEKDSLRHRAWMVNKRSCESPLSSLFSTLSTW